MFQTNDEKLISLKEAARISGYSPDYVGQLIRKGKIQGKQVYSNVAWMTTENAVLLYIEQEKGKKSGEKWLVPSQFSAPRGAFVFKTLLYVVIGLLIIVSLIFFYIFSTGIERSLHDRALNKVETQLR